MKKTIILISNLILLIFVLCSCGNNDTKIEKYYSNHSNEKYNSIIAVIDDIPDKNSLYELTLKNNTITVTLTALPEEDDVLDKIKQNSNVKNATANNFMEMYKNSLDYLNKNLKIKDTQIEIIQLNSKKEKIYDIIVSADGILRNKW